MSINKGERCTVHDNSNRVKWSVVTSSGAKGMVPGVCFTIPPPNQEAIDAAEKLKRQYERCIALWQKKQLRMRQNMIFATIKVVKSWDLAQVRMRILILLGVEVTFLLCFSHLEWLAIMIFKEVACATCLR